MRIEYFHTLFNEWRWIDEETMEGGVMMNQDQEQSCEIVKEFMKRMWDQDRTTISEADYSRLMSLAIIGAKLEFERSLLNSRFDKVVALPGAKLPDGSVPKNIVEALEEVPADRAPAASVRWASRV